MVTRSCLQAKDQTDGKAVGRMILVELEVDPVPTVTSVDAPAAEVETHLRSKAKEQKKSSAIFVVSVVCLIYLIRFAC